MPGTRQSYTPPASGLGTAVIDFGDTPSAEASVVVSGQTQILATSQVRVSMQVDTMLNNNADDHLLAALTMNFAAGAPVAGDGFTIYASSNFALWTKRFRLRWRW